MVINDKPKVTGAILTVTGVAYGLLATASLVQWMRPRTNGEDLTGAGIFTFPALAALVGLVSFFVGLAIYLVWRLITHQKSEQVWHLIYAITFAILSVPGLIYLGASVIADI